MAEWLKAHALTTVFVQHRQQILLNLFQSVLHVLHCNLLITNFVRRSNLA